MVSKTIPVDTFDLVIFGATGDLARRKIFPALFRRFIAGQILGQSRIVGAARQELTSEKFYGLVTKAIQEFVPSHLYETSQLQEFCQMLDYCRVDLCGTQGWTELGEFLAQDSRPIRTFYLSISPTHIESCTKSLDQFNLITPETRVVVEKPLGTDLASAQRLNAVLRSSFQEDQIFRIDHYLGKETVQNLMALRFANILLEPLWNNQYIDHVQITVAETGSAEGRGGYYDEAGAMRDMVQNHLMQLLCLIAMEPPAHFEANDIRNEKLKVIRSLAPVQTSDTVRGQYYAPEASFRDHMGNPNSKTESYVALKVAIQNWRWAGVPFYLRTGKGLSKKVSEIVVVFKRLPHAIFPDLGRDYQNCIVIRLQPHEGITLHLGVKEPGPGGMRLMNAPLDMSFAETFNEQEAIDAYERLIMDTIRGNQTLFMRGDEVEAAWGWIDNIIAAWEKDNKTPIEYPTGSSGPEEAIALISRDHRHWQGLDSR